MGDSVVPDAKNRLEVASKPHLASDSCVADLFKIDAHPAYGGTALLSRLLLAEHLKLKK